MKPKYELSLNFGMQSEFCLIAASCNSFNLLYLEESQFPAHLIEIMAESLYGSEYVQKYKKQKGGR